MQSLLNGKKLTCYAIHIILHRVFPAMFRLCFSHRQKPRIQGIYTIQEYIFSSNFANRAFPQVQNILYIVALQVYFFDIQHDSLYLEWYISCSVY
jgi:hypothetical protein